MPGGVVDTVVLSRHEFRARQAGAGASLRVVAAPAEGPRALIDALADEALTLSMNMEALEGALRGAVRDRALRAAVRTMRARLHEMHDVAGAFADLLTVLSGPEGAALVGDDAPLAEYLRGVVAWWAGTLRALERLREELESLSADWVALRRRFDDASAFLLPELLEAARGDISASLRAGHDPALEEIAEYVDVLATTTEWLSAGLQERFG